MAKRGRKSKADNVLDNLDKIREMSKLGTREEDIARYFDVSVSTFEKYKNEYPQLKESLKKGKQDLIVTIKNALYKRACGYDYEEKKQYITEDDEGNKKRHTEIMTKHMPPDVGAINSFLQNIDDNWFRDKRNYELKKQELELRKEMAEKNEW